MRLFYPFFVVSDAAGVAAVPVAAGSGFGCSVRMYLTIIQR